MITDLDAVHSSPRSASFYRSLPKVELHRHLEGSLRLTTMMEVAREYGLEIMGTDHLRSLVQVQEEDPFTFQNFLSKFVTLRLFYRSAEVISRMAYEAVADAAADNVRYLELRFTPRALTVVGGYQLGEVMDWVADSVQAASQDYGVITRLIASVNRHESFAVAEEVAVLVAERKDRGFVGLDMAGNEAQFPAAPFAGIFREARQSGLHITIHAGEWGGAENVAEAIVTLGAERIGHGVCVMNDPGVVELAADRHIPFEVCVTSNHQSGVVPALPQHPLRRMLDAGLNVTINTDDPSVSDITLGHEYQVVCESLGLPLSSLKDCVLSGARAAFLSPVERQKLVELLSEKFSI